MPGTITIGGLKAGLLSGSETIGPYTISGSATVGQVTDVTVVSGDNTLAVPAGATVVLAVVSPTNSAALKVRTNLNSGDAGLPVGTAGPVLLPIAAGVTSLIVNAAAGGATLEATFI